MIPPLPHRPARYLPGDRRLVAAAWIASASLHALVGVGIGIYLAGPRLPRPARSQRVLIRVARLEPLPEFAPQVEPTWEIEVPPDEDPFPAAEVAPPGEPEEVEPSRKDLQVLPPRPMRQRSLEDLPPSMHLTPPEPPHEPVDQPVEDVAAEDAASEEGVGDAEPSLLEAPPPTYPPTARRWGWEGTVTCRITVTVEGWVERVIVERSSGHGALDRAALEAVRRWRFRPGLHGGRATRMELLHRVTFRIGSGPGP